MIYEFPTKNFRASDGYANIQVVDGKLALPEKPDKDTLALIKKHKGKEVKAKQVIKKRKGAR